MIVSLSVGDIIYTERKHGLYSHYGIYVGENQVVHFSAPKGKETDAESADIIQTSIEEFLRGDKLFVLRDKPDSDYKPFPPDVIVERAKSKIGKCGGTYSLVSNNCEHFAYWCRYGVKESVQVDAVATAVVLFLYPLVIGSTVLSLFDKNSIQVVDSLGINKIAEYFKNPRRMKLLQEDSKYMAIATKEEFGEKLLRIACCIFDVSSNAVVNMNDIAIFQTRRLEKDLGALFGEKQMIVLR